eukprot:13931130-Alexandrium_andersonii.AAC.1
MARARGGARSSSENSAGPIGPLRPLRPALGLKRGDPLERSLRPSEGLDGPRRAPCSFWAIS